MIIAAALWVGPPPPGHRRDDPARRGIPQAAAHQLGRKGRITREGIKCGHRVLGFLSRSPPSILRLLFTALTD